MHYQTYIPAQIWWKNSHRAIKMPASGLVTMGSREGLGAKGVCGVFLKHKYDLAFDWQLIFACSV